MKTGIQVSSLKPLLTTTGEVHEAFRKMADLGSGPVQLQWIDPAVPLEEIAGALKENRMVSVSVQDFYQLVKDNFEYYVNLNEATGGVWLCVSRIPEDRKSPEGLDLFIGELREMQKKLDPYGQKICFHPVSADYQAVPGMDAVQWLLENMPELEVCLDLYHLNKNCTDMPAFIRRYAGRICMVHFKDGIGDKLVPAGQGDTRWDGVVQACLDAGVPYGFAEQEKWDTDPYDCLKQAMDWIEAQM
jgi:sugar phosphate isomerase/epimerase